MVKQILELSGLQAHALSVSYLQRSCCVTAVYKFLIMEVIQDGSKAPQRQHPVEGREH